MTSTSCVIYINNYTLLAKLSTGIAQRMELFNINEALST
jgi:hypothetical protein